MGPIFGEALFGGGPLRGAPLREGPLRGEYFSRWLFSRGPFPGLVDKKVCPDIVFLFFCFSHHHN